MCAFIYKHVDKWYSCRENKVQKGLDTMKCCFEHIELAMEMYIDEHEEAPILEMVPEEEKLSTTCEFCSEHAVYMVGN